MSELTIGAVHYDNTMPLRLQKTRETRSIRSGALNAKGMDHTERSRPGFEIPVAFGAYGDFYGGSERIKVEVQYAFVPGPFPRLGISARWRERTHSDCIANKREIQSSGGGRFCELRFRVWCRWV